MTNLGLNRFSPDVDFPKPRVDIMQLSVDGIDRLLCVSMIPPYLLKNCLQVIFLTFSVRVTRSSVRWGILMLGLVIIAPVLVLVWP